ncbi:MAG TPA: hypothetical protein VIX80_04550 [Candidatus Kapabacteria bacterium]
MKWLVTLSFIIVFTSGIFTGCTPESSAPETTQSTSKIDETEVAKAIEVQNKYNDELLAIPNVIGTGIGADQNGTPVIYLFTGEGFGMQGYPGSVGGFKTRIEPVGFVKALAVYTGTYRTPIWSGVSIGNDKECAAGTLGCVVSDNANGKMYILSNNHVLARENKAAIGERIDQPGRFETNCVQTGQIAKLSKFVTITMRRNADNLVDAAIAEFTATGFTSQMALGAAYTPTAAPVNAFINQSVKKVGRTTGLTNGIVSAVNVKVNVQYSKGVAGFAGQFYITPGTFSAAGDSGSLIVDDNTNNPVGLLFAGGNTGTFANGITNVLNAFNVSIIPN